MSNINPTEEQDPIDYLALHSNENAFDFPCSYGWRCFYEETIYGRYLPPIEPIQKPELLPRIPPEHKLYDELQQTKGLLLHLQKDLNLHIDEKKRKDVI